MHDHAKPEASVIIPCYNFERYIAEAIESVLRQTYKQWELIVVDDGSTDGSADVVRAYCAQDERIHLVQQKNGGEARARNTGLSQLAASSQFVYFLDADDLMEPVLLERMISYLKHHSDVGLVYGKVEHIDEHGNRLGLKWPRIFNRRVPTRWGVRTLKASERATPFLALFESPKPMIQTCVLRREVINSIGGFEEGVLIGPDLDFLWRAALRYPVHFMDEVLALYRRHPTQITADPTIVKDGKQALYEWWRARRDFDLEEHHQVRAAWYFRYGRMEARRLKSHAMQSWQQGAYIRSVKQVAEGMLRYAYSFTPPGWNLPLVGNQK